MTHHPFLLSIFLGRFLLTLSVNRLVQLWDLGINPGRGHLKEPISSMAVTSDDNNVRWMQTTSDGMGIRLLVHSPMTSAS